MAPWVNVGFFYLLNKKKTSIFFDWVSDLVEWTPKMGFQAQWSRGANQCVSFYIPLSSGNVGVLFFMSLIFSFSIINKYLPYWILRNQFWCSPIWLRTQEQWMRQDLNEDSFIYWLVNYFDLFWDKITIAPLMAHKWQK